MIDLSDVLLGICLAAAAAAAFLWSIVAGLLVVAVAAGVLAFAFQGQQVNIPRPRLPRVRWPWRS